MFCLIGILFGTLTDLFSVILHCIKFPILFDFLMKISFWQNLQIMTKEEIKRQANFCQHFSHRRPPLTSWLLNTKGAYDKLRLEAVGNIVIPRCAALAMQIMAAAHKQQFE